MSHTKQALLKDNSFLYILLRIIQKSYADNVA